MKIYEAYNSYGTEDFEENKKFSCHSWLFMCIKNIQDTFHIIQRNSSYINEKDLVGKYNAVNYLLDIYSYHQTSKFRNYPKERNYELDFSIILYGLLEHDADILSVDYERKTFLENLQAAFNSQKDLSWKQKNFFVSSNSFLICKSNSRKATIVKMLENEKRPIYLGLNLELSLSNNRKEVKKFKL
jgi:hypothetical protein